MPRTPRKPLGQLDVIFLEVNRDIIPMNRRPVGGDMVTEELAIGLTRHTMFVRNPKDPKRVYALAVPAELAQEAPWGGDDAAEDPEPPDTLGPLEEALLSYLRDPSEGIMTYSDGGIRVSGVPSETRVTAERLLSHVLAERAVRSEHTPVNPAIEALFRWRDGATDRYGDDLVNLLLAEFLPAEFSSDPEVSHHNRRDVPKEHQVGLMAFRALPYEEQARLVEAFCRR